MHASSDGTHGIPSPPLPRFLLTLTALVTLVGTITVGWWTTSSWVALSGSIRRNVELQKHIGDILLYDEILTMSCRAAAFTGDARWIQRYDDYVVELAGALTEASALAPEMRGFIEDTSAANDALVAIERTALALVRLGRLSDAAEQLERPAYTDLKAQYADGMHEAVDALNRRLAESIDEQEAIAQRSRTVTVLVILLIVGLWGLAWRALSGWHASTVSARGALERLHGRLDDAVEAASLGVFTLADRGDDGKLSPRGREILALADDAPFDEAAFVSRVLPADRAPVSAALRESWRPEITAARAMEFRVAHTGQTVRWVRAAWRPDRNGRPGRVLHGIMQDIDRQKRLTEELSDRAEAHGRLAEQRLAQSRALVRDIQQAEVHERLRLAHILHCDLQQLLFSARMQAATERDRTADEDGRLQAIVRTLDEAIAATRGVTTRIAPSPVEELGLGGALAALADLVAERFGLRPTLDVPETLPALREERVRFVHDCVQELLFNVVRHARVDEARVEVAVDDTRLTVTVSDAGRGFDPERPARQKVGGFGLNGLRRQAAAFGGELTIDARPGEGTRAALVLPLASASPSVESPPDGAPPSGARFIRLVHVEDNEAMRNLVAGAIAAEPDLHLVAQAESAPEGVALALQHRPDVVLMDQVFSWGYDGAEACRRIREAAPEVRVVGLAGLTGERDRAALEAAGAAAVLSKQTSFTALFEAVRRVGGRALPTAALEGDPPPIETEAASERPRADRGDA